MFIRRPAGRAIAAVPLLSLIAFPLYASIQQHDLALAQVTDPTIHVEIAQLGLYPEITGDDSVVALDALPLRSFSSTHVEFFGDGVRVRIEAQPFEQPAWVKRSHGALRLEGSPIIGWSGGAPHTRLSRVEVVMDGAVIELPPDAFTDLFDPPLSAQAADGAVLFATAARSRYPCLPRQDS